MYASTNSMRTVVVEGVRKKIPAEGESLDQHHTVRLCLAESAPIRSLWDELHKNGYELPYSVQKHPIVYTRSAVKKVLSTYKTVTVIADDQQMTESQIRLNDRLITHANVHYGEPLEFDIGSNGYENSRRPTQSLRGTLGFNATFQRTLRMPDDDKLHQLPGTLGTYDLFNVETYADRLPKEIRDAGGVFFPMWQREAMWINFDMAANSWAPKWAVRVYVGRINAVSGLSMNEDSKNSEKEAEQDYIVIPGQRWLDGICVAPGVVRQFVAMPLGSGYTVEGQKTSEEKYGGLQIEVIPELKRGLRWWVSDTIEHISYSENGFSEVDRKKGIDEWKTAAEGGLRVGDVLRCYAEPVVCREPVIIKDLFDIDGHTTWKAQYPSRYKSLAQPELAALEALVDAPLGGRQAGSTGSVPESSKVIGRDPTGPVPVPTIFSPQAPAKAPAKHDYVEPPHNGQSLTNLVSSKQLKKHMIPFDSVPPVHSSPHDHGPLGSVPSSKVGPPLNTNVKEAPKPDIGGIENLRFDEPKLQSSNEPVVDIETKDLKAMGLAAGGKLVQDIYKDPYPSNIWNYAAARTIYVHILDPVSCERITNIVPLPPPMDVRTYTENGGQFYVVEEKVDERIEGGDFDDIKSVSQMDKQVGLTTEPEFDPLKPKQCTSCYIRLCDCIIRPCDHQFCNVCIRRLEREGEQDQILARRDWRCPKCNQGVSRVAGFSAPMNLPGEEPLRLKVPVHIMGINDGRTTFKSIRKTRV